MTGFPSRAEWAALIHRDLLIECCTFGSNIHQQKHYTCQSNRTSIRKALSLLRFAARTVTMPLPCQLLLEAWKLISVVCFVFGTIESSWRGRHWKIVVDGCFNRIKNRIERNRWKFRSISTLLYYWRWKALDCIAHFESTSDNIPISITDFCSTESATCCTRKDYFQGKKKKQKMWLLDSNLLFMWITSLSGMYAVTRNMRVVKIGKIGNHGKLERAFGMVVA